MEEGVTVIIPTYRRPELLRRAIRSAITQNHLNLEVLVCDNASGDATKEIVEGFIAMDSRIRYRVRKKNLGVNRNIGDAILEVRTPYFSILPDDDVMLPEFHKSTLRGIQDHPDAAFSAGRSLLMTDVGRPVTVMPSLRTKAGYYTAPHGILSIISGHMVSHLALNGILCRTDLAREYWPASAEHGFPADIEFILKLSARYPYVLCDDIVFLICLHEDNLAKPRVPLYHGWLRVYRKLASENWLPEPYRSSAKRKFFLQLRNSFTKIWFRCVAQENWGEAYILADLLEEEFGLPRWSKTIFKATQFFRKNPVSVRRLRLCESLERRDEKYWSSRLRQFEKYAEYLKEKPA